MPELTTSQRWNFRLLARTGSVLKALNILNRPAASFEIAVILGISPPTARRRLADLEAMGFVARVSETGCYAACADFDHLLAGDTEPEAGQVALEQVAPAAEVEAPQACPTPPPQGVPLRVSAPKTSQWVGKKYFSPPGAVVAVKYLINLYQGLTTTATTAPPGEKIFLQARAPGGGGPRPRSLGPPQAHAPPENPLQADCAFPRCRPIKRFPKQVGWGKGDLCFEYQSAS